MSGAIARRLSRPFDELATIARDIGSGKLSTRTKLPRRAHGEVSVLAAALDDMAIRIERQMADQRELLAAVSHELRTPLTRIRLLTEIARDGMKAEDETRFGKTFDEIDREVIEIDALVSELLASSRLDFAALNPHHLDARELGRCALERANLSPDLLVAEGAPLEIEADPTLVSRALINLLENAKRHAGGVTLLRVRGGESWIQLEVEDAGPGIPAGDEARIFESFYQRRAGEEAREKGSLGLGLALVRRIAEAHGGKAYARNREESPGACVGIELPIR